MEVLPAGTQPEQQGGRGKRLGRGGAIRRPLGTRGSVSRERAWGGAPGHGPSSSRRVCPHHGALSAVPPPFCVACSPPPHTPTHPCLSSRLAVHQAAPSHQWMAGLTCCLCPAGKASRAAGGGHERVPCPGAGEGVGGCADLGDVR